MKQINLKFAASVFALSLLLVVGSSSATADTFTFTTCHLSNGCATAANFGTLSLTQFSALFGTDGNRFVEMGAWGKYLFSFNDDNDPHFTITEWSEQNVSHESDRGIQWRKRHTGTIDGHSGSVPDGGMTVTLLGCALFGVELLRRKIRA